MFEIINILIPNIIILLFDSFYLFIDFIYYFDFIEDQTFLSLKNSSRENYVEVLDEALPIITTIKSLRNEELYGTVDLRNKYIPNIIVIPNVNSSTFSLRCLIIKHTKTVCSLKLKVNDRFTFATSKIMF